MYGAKRGSVCFSFAEPEGEKEGGYVGLESQSLLGEEEDPAETAALAGEGS